MLLTSNYTFPPLAQACMEFHRFASKFLLIFCAENFINKEICIDRKISVRKTAPTSSKRNWCGKLAGLVEKFFHLKCGIFGSCLIKLCCHDYIVFIRFIEKERSSDKRLSSVWNLALTLCAGPIFWKDIHHIPHPHRLLPPVSSAQPVPGLMWLSLVAVSLIDAV